MKIGSGIEKLYPGAGMRGDAVVTADTGGVRVSYWNTAKLGPMPSLEEIDAAGQQAEQETISDKAEKSTVLSGVLAILAKPDADVTNAELKWLVLKMAKYIVRKGL